MVWIPCFPLGCRRAAPEPGCSRWGSSARAARHLPVLTEAFPAAGMSLGAVPGILPCGAAKETGEPRDAQRDGMQRFPYILLPGRAPGLHLPLLLRDAGEFLIPLFRAARMEQPVRFWGAAAAVAPRSPRSGAVGGAPFPQPRRPGRGFAADARGFRSGSIPARCSPPQGCSRTRAELPPGFGLCRARRGSDTPRMIPAGTSGPCRCPPCSRT